MLRAEPTAQPRPSHPGRSAAFQIAARRRSVSPRRAAEEERLRASALVIKISGIGFHGVIARLTQGLEDLLLVVVAEGLQRDP